MPVGTEYASHDNSREVLKRLKTRLVSYDAFVKDASDKIEYLLNYIGMTSPMYFYVEANGDLYVYYDDGYGPPNVEYEPDTGDLYWIFYILDNNDFV